MQWDERLDAVESDGAEAGSETDGKKAYEHNYTNIHEPHASLHLLCPMHSSSIAYLLMLHNGLKTLMILEEGSSESLAYNKHGDVR